MSDEQKTHFGYQQVNKQDKASLVGEVFHSVADKYDLMNDLMSLGIHRLWKPRVIALSHIRPGNRVLDLAGGTGDLARDFAKRVGERGTVVLSDINSSMLNVGRDRLLDAGIVNNIEFVQADAQYLPFHDNDFNCISIGFGLRNVTDISKALQEMQRVLKPGGCLLILEFSKPRLPGLKPIYDTYSFKLLPKLGKLIANDEESYRYLVESIRMHPDQETLKNMALDAGFDKCEYFNLSGGIVAIHRAYKY